MDPHTFFRRRAIGTIVVFAVLALVLGFYALNSYIYNEKQDTSGNYEPYRARLSGEFVCLPHKNQAGPQTGECAFGLKATDGSHYAVDFNLMSQTVPQFAVGDQFTASGVVTPIERLSADHWRTYDIVGIFSVTDSIERN